LEAKIGKGKARTAGAAYKRIGKEDEEGKRGGAQVRSPGARKK